MRHFSWITHLHLVPRLRAYKDLHLRLLFTSITWYSFTKITFTFFAHTNKQKHVLEFVLKIKTFMFSLSMNSGIKDVMKCKWTEQSAQYVIMKRKWTEKSAQYVVMKCKWTEQSAQYVIMKCKWTEQSAQYVIRR